MYRLATRNVVVSFPRWCSLALLLRSPARSYGAFRPSLTLPYRSRRLEQVCCFKNHKVLRASSKNTKKSKASNDALNDKDLSHLLWWKERLEMCRKPSTAQLVKRLTYSNLLGVDVNLKNGSLKEGTLNWEMLQFKSRFPREVLLSRVGDFYEAIGIDACILVEYAGLNPFGGLRSDSIPRAGCPVMNLRQTLDDLTRNGYSVCIVEEVQGPTQARTRKSRFISGHAHPGSPYVFGLVGVDHDLDFPEPVPVVGISRSASGYCINLVLETMKTYSSEDGLTEEAIVTKLRTCRCHHLFLHASLRNNSSGTCRWGEFGEGGLLWGECSARQFEWFEGNPVNDLLLKVKELYGLDDEVTFRNVTVSSENRPQPLTLGTATQIGAIPTDGIPCLLKVLLPSNCSGLPVLYIRDLLLNPPAYEIASAIQETCKLMSNVTCSIPEFTCVSSAKLVKLLEQREANHIEFCRIKNVLDEILNMYKNSELKEILKLLMDPTWVATGLKIDFETLVSECEGASYRIGEMISLDGESDQKISSSSVIPSDFFEDMESSWKGRVKRRHIEEEFTDVQRAADALTLAVTEDFLPIIFRIKATTAPFGGPKGEILYAREHEAVWFKGKRFAPSVWAGTPGEEQIKRLKPAADSRGRKVGEEWFTTMKVEDALTRYHEAGAKAKVKVLRSCGCGAKRVRQTARHPSLSSSSSTTRIDMASIVANLPPPLLVHGRKTIFRNLQKLPVSSFRETQNHVTVLVKATGESSESSTSLSIVKSVQSFWDKSEDRFAFVGLGFAAIVAFWASANLITAVDKLPLIPSFLELIGILFSSWFIYRYLLFKPDREELFQLVKKSISDILGQ